MTRRPPPPPPRRLVDVAVDPPFGLILVAASEHQEPWLSALLLRCVTCPLWHDRDDTQPGTWETVAARPPPAGLRHTGV